MVGTSIRAIQVNQHGEASVLNPTAIPRPTYRPDQASSRSPSLVSTTLMSLSERVATPALFLSMVAKQELPLSSLVTRLLTRLSRSDLRHNMDSKSATGSRSWGATPMQNMSLSIPSTWPNIPIVFLLLISCKVSPLLAWFARGTRYTVQKGDWIVIHAAAGGVGLLATQLALLLGAHVIGTVSTEEKATLAKAAGAEYVVLINNGYEALEKKVHELTNGQGVHAVLDSIGQVTFESILNTVRRLGALVLYGHASGTIPPFLLVRLSGKNVRVTWTDLENYIRTREEFGELYGELAEHLAKGQLKVDIHKVYSFDEVQQAHLDLEGRKSTGRLLIKIA